jgi:prephenate dehydrogenase
MLIDILLTNRAAVLASVDRYVERLTGLRAGLAVGDEAGLRAALAAIANERRQWGRGRTL